MCYRCYYAGKPRNKLGQGKQSSGAGGGNVGAAVSTGPQCSTWAAPVRTSVGGATGRSGSGCRLYQVPAPESEPSDGKDTESWDGRSSARGGRRRTSQVHAQGPGTAKRRKNNGTTGGDGLRAGQGALPPPKASAGGCGTGKAGPGPWQTQQYGGLEQRLEQQQQLWEQQQPG